MLLYTVLQTVSVHCYCTLLLHTVTVHCYCILVLYNFNVHRYCKLLLFTVTIHCYCKLLLFTVTIHCYCSLNSGQCTLYTVQGKLYTIYCLSKFRLGRLIEWEAGLRIGPGLIRPGPGPGPGPGLGPGPGPWFIFYIYLNLTLKELIHGLLLWTAMYIHWYWYTAVITHIDIQ